MSRYLLGEENRKGAPNEEERYAQSLCGRRVSGQSKGK